MGVGGFGVGVEAGGFCVAVGCGVGVSVDNDVVGDSGGSVVGLTGALPQPANKHPTTKMSMHFLLKIFFIRSKTDHFIVLFHFSQFPSPS